MNTGTNGRRCTYGDESGLGNCGMEKAELFVLRERVGSTGSILLSHHRRIASHNIGGEGVSWCCVCPSALVQYTVTDDHIEQMTFSICCRTCRGRSICWSNVLY